MKLATLFQDGAVLQRQNFVPIWGWAKGSALIRAEINSIEVYVRASVVGEFLLRLPPMEAGGPYVLTVSDVDNGESITLQDVMVGEVWLASGQSNMEHCLYAEDARKGQYEEFVSLTKEDPSCIRAIMVSKGATGVRESTFEGTWMHMDENNCKNISAVALWHAYYLQKRLGVTVGVITSSYGGTIVEAWTSREALLRNPATELLVANNDIAYSRIKEMWIDGKYDGYSKTAFRDEGNKGVDFGWASFDFDDGTWGEMSVPGSWIAQNIAGNGVVWIRKKVVIPSAWSGHELVLELGGIDKHDTSYFNGEEIGKTGEGFDIGVWDAERAYRIKPEMVKEGENLIAVRGFSFVFDGAFCTGSKRCALTCPDLGAEIDLSGKWRVQAELDRGKIEVRHYGAEPGCGNSNSPGILFDSMIAPLIPYAIKGAIWYQGESNAKDPLSGEQYKSKMSAMIDDWRYRWGQGDFPFIQVELAMYMVQQADDESALWPLIRKAQNDITKSEKNVFVASAIDVGDAWNIHPTDKKSVGNRLARVALLEVYHEEDVKAYGPQLVEAAYAGDGFIRLRFIHAAGLHFLRGKAEGFFVADVRQQFVEATSVVIDGNSILVKADIYQDPIAVRYGWADNPCLSLYNGEGLPASPFRTDLAKITH